MNDAGIINRSSLNQPPRAEQCHDSPSWCQAFILEHLLACAADDHALLNRQLPRDKISLNVWSNQPTGWISAAAGGSQRCPRQRLSQIKPARHHPCKHRSMNKRTDQVTALLIEAVIKASQGQSTTEAACILCGYGVPLAVALRVLTRPSDRRRIVVK